MQDEWISAVKRLRRLRATGMCDGCSFNISLTRELSILLTTSGTLKWYMMEKWSVDVVGTDSY
jgi:hypothetical protein